jgi:hypothetical protein
VRQRFRISLFKTETQLTLCDSALGYCAGTREKGKQNLWPNEERFDLSVIGST